MANRRRYDVERLFGNPETLLGFMRRTRKPVFHKSNIFLRDIQFAIRDYFDTVEAKPISLPLAGKMAKDVIDMYTEVGLLRKVDNQAYVLEAPEFQTPTVGGTYSMLTIHGAPLPVNAEMLLELATVGTPVDPKLREEVLDYKGGDVAVDGATLAALTLPTEVPDPAPESAPSEHAYQDIGTDQGPQPQVQPQIPLIDPTAEPEKKEETVEPPDEQTPSQGMMPPWMSP